VVRILPQCRLIPIRFPRRAISTVILGEVSGGLICRDFDRMEAFDADRQSTERVSNAVCLAGEGVHVATK
jgi:hypothetical protein